MRLNLSLKPLAALFLAVVLAACQTAQTSAPITPTQPAAQSQVQSASLPVISYAPATAVERGFSALVINAATGEELFAEDASAPRYPASLTKMMTLYLLFEAVSSGRYSLSSPLNVSANAASQPPAKIGLKAGSTITVEQAARALSVKSANDVGVAVAENLAGSERAFARKMTQKARALGLTKTRFVNATGLPDPAQVTTARDMAKLGLALKRTFPQYASYYRARSFIYNGRSFKATNNLLGKVAGVDGLKTGYVRMSGYNLVATARRGGKQLVVVVMGGKSEAARDREVTRLLEAYF
ncbi:MAG: D-alanyl-D-alanine carboxypeptidase [Roseibium sp.]|uniref:D-alanyl-D-alanine carboxypeptidase family protein n=1 Tax=Roseibium sp. TaxID=1936156 RepID=UPI001AFDA24F|nr:D-alanyl-D-alanine carboxypeptidase family protein [Roseibium sp.]MBO6893478.1 D-alanyl-D-alanine carboxypeptidase [Roseibium sp.]MBO6930658.1 D-alanyl-D-alanine carboxypeptidase [Roseibium sp.]